MKNVIFFTHAEKTPSGGAKYIYRYSQIIDKMNNFSSKVIHIKKKKISKYKDSVNKIFTIKKNFYSGWQVDDITCVKDFKYNWFKNKIKTKENFIFNRERDFVILPEIFAHFADKLLIKKKIGYAIFVQNGYSINSTNDEKSLLKAYVNAKFILSGSKDITNCIKFRFPKLETKISKISYFLDVGDFNFKKKRDIITYSSRKLPDHSNLVRSFLSPNLKKKWILKNLYNLSYDKYLSEIKKSKIFLSFSNLEGLGLPPIEAALAGNYVIGYTGEGGNEYWFKPLFKKINSGEIKNFVASIIKLTTSNKINDLKFKNTYLKIKKKFSKENELKSIKRFLKLI